MLPEVAPEELNAVLDEVIGGVLADAGVSAPPVDALVVAEALHIVVAVDQRQRSRGRYVCLGGVPGDAGGSLAGGGQASIWLRPEPRVERRQWAVAHEIGEHVAHRVFAALRLDPRAGPPSARESMANALASRLLLPSDWFAAEARASDWDVPSLKQHFRTASHELVARRLLDLEPHVIITICDQGSLTYRRSNAPGIVPPLSRPERECWQALYDIRQPDDGLGFGAVRGWRVHEAGWRREILRTAVADFEGT